MRCVHPINDAAGRRLPCGRCIGCRVNRGQEWGLRLSHEMDYHVLCSFVSLTYAKEFLPEDGGLRPKHLQDFLKRLRHEIDRKIKYYAVGEYGEDNSRPHYHMILFGIGLHEQSVVEGCWGKGLVHFGSVTSRSINYVTDYINKKLYGPLADAAYKGRHPPFARMSKGLGRRWLDENIEQVLQFYGVRKGGKVLPLPRYYHKIVDGIYPIELLNALTEKRSNEACKPGATSEDIVHLWERDVKVRAQAEADLKALLGTRKQRK